MNTVTYRPGLELRSHIGNDGLLTLSLLLTPAPDPAPDEVIVQVEAAPINPSDLALLVGGADMTTLAVSGEGADKRVTASVTPSGMRAMAGRIGQSLPVGNEGAGIVVRAGSSDAAQALLGKSVGMVGGGMFTQYRCINVANCMLLPDGVTPAEGASAFVNPQTALGMVETMRMEGHKALVHTAAASSLGRMLNRVCLGQGVGLVNIVRSEQQAALLRDIGAGHVCNSNSPDFLAELTAAIDATGATLAFDAIGGGKLAGQILGCMEASISGRATEYSRYGSAVHKQVYIYGGLDLSPTIITRNFGMTWGVGGWLLFPFLQKIGPVRTQELRAQIGAGLKTTFASHYTQEISLVDVLEPDVIARYAKASTGGKYLINPSRS